MHSLSAVSAFFPIFRDDVDITTTILLSSYGILLTVYHFTLFDNEEYTSVSLFASAEC
jgi:hypothetical protein